MATPLKDLLFNRTSVEATAGELAGAIPGFAKDEFIARALNKFPELELKQRAAWIAHAMRSFLGTDYPLSLQILLGSLPDDAGRGQCTGFDDFRYMPHVTFVELFGQDHPDLSLRTLYRLTKYFTGEGAIRPYLLHHTGMAMAYLNNWVADDDWRVRRLVSEGTRPRLPWAPRLPMFVADPTPVLDLLTQLQDDPNEVVRRSVANNLNDIAKDHPDRVMAVTRGWIKSASPEKIAMIRHGLRGLIKQGHAPTLGLLGYDGKGLGLRKLSINPRRLTLGGTLSIEASLIHKGKGEGRFVLDYALHFLGSRGQYRRKVFKGGTVQLRPGQEYIFARRHKIEKITTRVYYPGTHRVELLANGKPLGFAEFILALPKAAVKPDKPSRI